MDKSFKIIGSAVIIAALAGIVFQANAQNSNATGQNINAKATTVKGLVKTRLTEEKTARVRQFASNIDNRMETAVNNLESLSLRIQNRIDKLFQEGKDVAQAQAKLDEAKARIQETKDALAELKDKIETIISSDNPRMAFANTWDRAVKAAIGKIRAAHKALVDTVVILKRGLMSGSDATSTSGTSTSQ